MSSTIAEIEIKDCIQTINIPEEFRINDVRVIMKTIIYSCLIYILILANSVSAGAQNNAADKQAIQMLKFFYRAYNMAWTTGKGSDILTKTDALRKKYCTIKLRKELEEISIDHDPLIADKCTDAAHLKTLSITKDPAKANAYVINYIAYAFNGFNSPISGQVVVHVTVAKEGADLKISSVR